MHRHKARSKFERFRKISKNLRTFAQMRQLRGHRAPRKKDRQLSLKQVLCQRIDTGCG